jgi:chemotaxis protein histidine kinase CheA
MTDELFHLRSQFFHELASTCEDLEQDFLHLEQNPGDVGTLKSLLRDIHTVKGNAGLVGEPVLQSLCHTLESTLDRLQQSPNAPEAAELGLGAVDLLKAAAEAQEVVGVEERVRAYQETLANAAPGGRTVVPVSSDTESGSESDMSLSEWKRLVCSFAAVEDRLERLTTDTSDRRAVGRAGTAAIDFSESVGQASLRLREIAALLEETLGSVASLPKTFMPQCVEALQPLLRSLVSRIRDELTTLFRRNSFSVTVTVRNLEMLAALDHELRSRRSAPVLILKIDVDYADMEREASVYDSFWSLAASPEHTVAFVIPWSSAVDKAAAFLQQAIGTAPLVSSDEWQTLRQIAHHVTSEQQGEIDGIYSSTRR